MLNHREIYIQHTNEILTIPVGTQLRDWTWDAERGFCFVETGLQLQADTGSFSSSPSHSIRKLPFMTYSLVWGCGKLARITRLHCTCRAVCASSFSGKSTSGGSQACRSELYGGCRAWGSRLWYREYVRKHYILAEHGVMRVRHRLPWCLHRGSFYIGHDPARGVTCQQGHNLQVRSVDPRAKCRHTARDDVGHYTLGNLPAMLPKLVINA